MKFPGDWYTRWYSWCLVATDTLVTATYDGNEYQAMHPRIFSDHVLNSQLRAALEWQTDITYCLLPSQVTRHKVGLNALPCFVELLIRSIVDLVFEVWVGKLVMKHLAGVTSA